MPRSLTKLLLLIVTETKEVLVDSDGGGKSNTGQSGPRFTWVSVALLAEVKAQLQ